MSDHPAPRQPFKRILLVNPPMEHIGAEFMMEDVPLRLEYLSAYIRPYVDIVEVLDLANGGGNYQKALKQVRPDLVGISINYISTHKNGLEMAKQAKEYGARVVVGGYQATAMVEHFAENPHIDWVVRGEGEETLRELVLGEVPLASLQGISYTQAGAVVHNPERPLIADLDAIPFPDRSRRNRKYRLPFADLDSNVSTAYEMIITSRGCWGRCTFCTEGLMTDGTQRYRKPEKVIEEIDELVKMHPGKRLRIHIADPNFGGKRRITEELFDRMIEYKQRTGADVHYFVSLRPSAIASSRELTRKMVAAGIDYLFVGMESPDNAELKKVLKGGETRERQELAAQYLREEGAEIMSNFLIGLPNQTRDDILGLVEYAKMLGLADCYFSVVTPLPGSQLYDEAVAEGRLLETDVTRYRLYDSVLRHDKLSRADIREMCVRANAKWYDDLMLPAEQRRAASNGRKRRLYDFAGKFTVLVNFFSFIGSGANNEFSDLAPSKMVMDMPTPRLREFTTKHKVSDFIEMRRFLKILGAQQIQVTLQAGGENIVSWAAKTTPTSIEHIECVPGVPSDEPTVRVNVPLDPGSLTAGKMVRRILADNPTVGARVGLLRIGAAAASEVAASYIDNAVEKVKSGVPDLIRDGRKRLGDWTQRMMVRAGLAQPPAPPARPTPPKPAPVGNRTPASIPTSRLMRKIHDPNLGEAAEAM